MMNQFFGSNRDKPETLDENEEEVTGEEQDISAEIFPVIPTPEVKPANAENKNEQPVHQGSSSEWTTVQEERKPQVPTNTQDPSKGWNWPDTAEFQQLRSQWSEIQGKFVDDPRLAVQQAEAFVSDVVDKTTRMIANEKQSIENEMKQQKDLSTEELRQVMQHYRSFFNRITFKG